MDTISLWFLKIIEIFKIPITLFGFTFSMWEVFLYGAAAKIIGWFLSGAVWCV